MLCNFFKTCLLLDCKPNVMYLNQLNGKTITLGVSVIIVASRFVLPNSTGLTSSTPLKYLKFGLVL